MIINLGTMFITLVIILMIPLWIIFTKPCKYRSKWLSKNHESLTKSLRGNMFIRFILEGCLDIAICSALNWI